MQPAVQVLWLAPEQDTATHSPYYQHRLHFTITESMIRHNMLAIICIRCHVPNITGQDLSAYAVAVTLALIHIRLANYNIKPVCCYKADAVQLHYFHQLQHSAATWTPSSGSNAPSLFLRPYNHILTTSVSSTAPQINSVQFTH